MKRSPSRKPRSKDGAAVLGVGLDLEPVSSFRAKNPSRDRRFFERIFTPAEMSYCRKFRDPAPRFAARFCAKEALVKAASSILPLYISDAEVRQDSRGAPRLAARSKRAAVRVFFSRYETFVSLTHTDEEAAAVVIVQRKR